MSRIWMVETKTPNGWVCLDFCRKRKDARDLASNIKRTLPSVTGGIAGGGIRVVCYTRSMDITNGGRSL